jgi:hypothetical protein
MATEDFPVLLAPSDSMLPLVEYPPREIWLSEAEVWLPSDDLQFYTDGSLFEGRAGSGVFSEERSPLSFRLKFTPLWHVPTTV